MSLLVELRGQAETFGQILESNNQNKKLMASVENVLFRKILDRADREMLASELNQKQL
jgi:hypothetical protein